MFRLVTSIALLSAATTLVSAQTSTECDPLKKKCPQDPALGTTFSTQFNESMSEFDPNLFNITAGADFIDFNEEGAQLTISSSGDSITVESAFYIFWGSVELIFKAAKGQGIISTLVLLSDDLDEIDWEIKGGNTSSVTCNYFGWGNTSQFNSEFIPTMGANWGSDGAMGDFHNYTVVWNQDQLEWILDGESVRTAPYQDAGLWPQTPSFLKFGIWAAGDTETQPEGTVKWAGGKTNWDDGPFTMTVKSLKMTDGTTNSSWYAYGDKSGSWESINVIDGQSNAYKYINDLSTSEELAKHWSGLSTGAKIGIACGVVGVFAIGMIAFCFYCVSQRKQGKREKEIADKAWDAQHAELMEYRNRMKRGDFAVGFMGHGEKF